MTQTDNAASPTRAINGTLPIILVAAVVQGWILYLLHLAIDTKSWPATHPEWLAAFYAVAAFIPLTIQLLAEHAGKLTMWIITASLAVVFMYFGWHHGHSVIADGTREFVAVQGWFQLGLVLGVLWLLALPFIQCRLADGTWRARYEMLFEVSWRFILMLAEAAFFTGIFWGLLLLWQQLFYMLGITFFRELFAKPIFIYPVNSIVIGFALYRIGSLDRMTSLVLAQFLNVLKWLALVAGLLLALFTITLIAKLPGMIASGERVISATWLLWLMAATVLLINAAYRDGTTAQPYPKWSGIGMRCVIPLTVIIAVTALYALCVRVHSYGFTVERVWALMVAVAACIYAVGYSFAVRDSTHWMSGMARVNIAVSLFLVVIVSLGLTPVLSPYRIAADSQFHRVQELSAAERNSRQQQGASLQYLRFNAGNYGMARLRQLENLQNHPRAADIREAAAAVLVQEQRDLRPVPVDISDELRAMVVYPPDRTPDAGLLKQLQEQLQHQILHTSVQAGLGFGGVFIDLNADQVEEFVLLTPGIAYLYERQSDAWTLRGNMMSSPLLVNSDLPAQIRAGNVHVIEPAWQELEIGSIVFRKN